MRSNGTACRRQSPTFVVLQGEARFRRDVHPSRYAVPREPEALPEPRRAKPTGLISSTFEPSNGAVGPGRAPAAKRRDSSHQPCGGCRSESIADPGGQSILIVQEWGSRAPSSGPAATPRAGDRPDVSQWCLHRPHTLSSCSLQTPSLLTSYGLLTRVRTVVAALTCKRAKLKWVHDCGLPRAQHSASRIIDLRIWKRALHSERRVDLAVTVTTVRLPFIVSA